MDSIKDSVDKIFKGALSSFGRFPAAIASALVISIVAIIKINMDWDMQGANSLLFDSIQLAFLLGAVFSMAAVAYEEVESENKRINPLISNISGILVAIITFLLLYFFSGRDPNEGIIYLSTIAGARVGVAIFVSLLAFIYIVSKARTVDSFSDSLFILEKAFVISALYGLVIMIGVSGVIGAFQALVYRGLSFRVYQYLGVGVGFLSYAVFLGYFPSFRSSEETPKMKEAKEQPRFIYVLFGYILVPIVMALTLVLFIWSARVIFADVDVSFAQLSSIASSYVVIGIWLHIMVSKHKTKLANFYKRAYPFSGLLVLAFEAWALVVQIDKFGIKTLEYSFILIWIFALISVLLLIFLKDKAYRKIAITAGVISIISVLPFIGYQDVSFNSQINRLERILNEEELLEGNNIIRADGQIETDKKAQITDAVDFIAYSEKDTPPWFIEDLGEREVFEDTFGFEKTYGLYGGEGDYISANLSLETDLIDISEYSLALGMDINERLDRPKTFEIRGGEYEFVWDAEFGGIPNITVKLDDEAIIEESLESYLRDLELKYPIEGSYMESELPFEDMNLVLEGGGLSILIVFDNININKDNIEDRTNYYINIHGVYIR